MGVSKAAVVVAEVAGAPLSAEQPAREEIKPDVTSRLSFETLSIAGSI
jgi:hypothetical protein